MRLAGAHFGALCAHACTGTHAGTIALNARCTRCKPAHMTFMPSLCNIPCCAQDLAMAMSRTVCATVVLVVLLAAGAAARNDPRDSDDRHAPEYAP
jgi:hypothetical protein